MQAPASSWATSVSWLAILAINNAGQVLGTGTPEGAIKANRATVTNESTGIISGIEFGIFSQQRCKRKQFRRHLGDEFRTASRSLPPTTERDQQDKSGTISGGSGRSRGYWHRHCEQCRHHYRNSVEQLGIFAETVNVTGNTGTISGRFAGIDVTTLANVANAGTISGGIFGLVSLSGGTINVTSNTGIISGGLLGVGTSKDVTVNNSGAILAGAGGRGIDIR